MDNSVQGLDQGLYYMKRFEDRWLKYSSTQSCQGETEITLLIMRIDTILWKEPSWIYDESHIMLLEHHGGGHPWILQEDFKMKIFLALASNLTWLCSHYKYQVLMPLQPESDPELNIKNIEKFLIFLIVICTLQYNKRSRSYDFLKLTELLKPRSGQNWSSWEISAFDPTLNVTSGNIPY
jgi:hypothetical protein